MAMVCAPLRVALHLSAVIGSLRTSWTISKMDFRIAETLVACIL